MKIIPEIIFLAGGFGGRMGVKYASVQKCMIRYEGIPLLQHGLEQAHLVFGDFIPILSIGYKKNQVLDYFGSRWYNQKIIYSEHEAGTEDSGALLASKKYLSGKPFFTIHGNIIFNGNILNKMYDSHLRNPAITTICVSNKVRESMHDFVRFKDEKSNQISKIYIPKPEKEISTTLANHGIKLDTYSLDILKKPDFTKLYFKEMGINVYDITIFELISKYNISIIPHMIWIYANYLANGGKINAVKYFNDWIHFQSPVDFKRKVYILDKYHD